MAVVAVLLVGGTAMAANLGLLTSTEPRQRGYELDVSTPALSVSLPTSDPAPPTARDGQLDDD